jgi:hypothetical protein
MMIYRVISYTDAGAVQVTFLTGLNHIGGTEAYQSLQSAALAVISNIG